MPIASHADECINRIRLEFKGQKTDRKNQNRKRINRIRLEFKGIQPSESAWLTSVLIESDWNLKLTVILTVFPDACINRIRLEFKV